MKIEGNKRLNKNIDYYVFKLCDNHQKTSE